MTRPKNTSGEPRGRDQPIVGERPHDLIMGKRREVGGFVKRRKIRRFLPARSGTNPLPTPLRSIR